MAKKKATTSRKTTQKKTKKKKTASGSAAPKPKAAAAKTKPKATARGAKVRDLMSTTVSVCHPHSSLCEAAQIMWQRDCGFVPVVGMATKTIAGVITDRDIAMSAAIHGQSLHDVQVHAAMNPTVHTIGADDSLKAAHELMRAEQLHRLPVVDAEDRVVGVLSLNDLARHAIDAKTSTAGRDVAQTLGEIGKPHPARTARAAKGPDRSPRKVKPQISDAAARAAQRATRESPGSMI